MEREIKECGFHRGKEGDFLLKRRMPSLGTSTLTPTLSCKRKGRHSPSP
jgi:hypothetical protein